MIYTLFFEKTENTGLYYKRKINGKRIHTNLLHTTFLCTLPRQGEIINFDSIYNNYYKVIVVEYYISETETYSQILLEKLKGD